MEMEKEKVIPCEVYSRVVGYFRPVQNWNDGKRMEFKERKMVDLRKIAIPKDVPIISQKQSSRRALSLGGSL